MSSPFTRLRTEDEEVMYDAGMQDGRYAERERILGLLTKQIDACLYWQAIRYDWPEQHNADCPQCNPIVRLISSIKGEGK